MKDPKRIDRITNKLNKLWNHFSNEALCQLIVNTTNTSDIFKVSDEELENLLDHWIRNTGI